MPGSSAAKPENVADRLARYQARTGFRFLAAAVGTAVLAGCAIAGFVVALLAFTGNSRHPIVGGIGCLVVLALAPGALAVYAARGLERAYGRRAILLRLFARGDHAAFLSAPALAARAGISAAEAIIILGEAQKQGLAPPTISRSASGSLLALGDSLEPNAISSRKSAASTPLASLGRAEPSSPTTVPLPPIRAASASRPDGASALEPVETGGFGSTVPMARNSPESPLIAVASPATVRLAAPLPVPVARSLAPVALSNLEGWSGRTLHETWFVEEPIGRGGMGVVFRAKHTRTGRRYALKVMLPGTSDDPAAETRALARFEREATAASRLGHPGIVQVHDFHRTPDGGAYLVMDLLLGETLAARLARTNRGGKLPFSEVRRLAREVGEALGAAHAQGLVHRDVKPANLFLVASPPRTVLVDFGLVKPPSDAAISLHTASGEVLGTPLYMAPEQARGGAVDARTDLYGLAMVVYEAVVGLPPFFGANLASAYAKLVSEEAPPASVAAPEACPPGFDAVIGKALAARPDERYPTVQAFVDALDAL